MAKQESGKIVNIASLNSVGPAALAVAYNVSKAGVVEPHANARGGDGSLRRQCERHQPRTDRDRIPRYGDAAARRDAGDYARGDDRAGSRIDSARHAGEETSDIAKTVLFLASSQSEWMTGQNLVVAGDYPESLRRRRNRRSATGPSSNRRDDIRIITFPTRSSSLARKTDCACC